MLQSRTAIFLALLSTCALLALWIESEEVIKSMHLRLDHLSHLRTPSQSNPQPNLSFPDPKLLLDKSKVATITDTQFTPNLIPLILHFHAVLGPSWPIIFFTSPSIIAKQLNADIASELSGSWKRAVSQGLIEVRAIPKKFNLSHRMGVNAYLASKWLWEQLAPADHVLVFQTDAIICANSPHVVEDFFSYSFIGAQMGEITFNGGLSLRNRTMILDILNEFEEGSTVLKGTEGEDGFYSRGCRARGGNMPQKEVANRFARQYPSNWDDAARPLGFHKLHKYVPKKIKGVARWCPEIMLTRQGTLDYAQ